MNLSSEHNSNSIKCGNFSKGRYTSKHVPSPIFSGRFSKRSQKDGSSAANLIAFLGLFIILYILFIPPAERDELLDGSGQESSTDPNDSVSGELVKTLLDEQPGEILHTPDDRYEHDIPSFTLRESTYSNMLVDENPFIVRRSWFSDSRRNIDFTAPPVEDVTRLLMTFSVDADPSGDLTIALNGREVYQGLIDQGTVDPFEVPREYLRENNTLTLSVSSPGLKFWDSNRYRISSLSLAGEFYDPEELENSHTFYLENPEVDNLQRSRLSFSPSCNRDTVGRLSVTINGESIFSGIPDCNTLNRINFNPDILDEENTVNFISSGGGDYTISLAKIDTTIESQDNPRYSFELSESEFDDIRSGEDDLNLRIGMQDDESFKEAYVLVNSVKFFLNTRDNVFEKRIPGEVIQRGKNTIELQPLNTFEAISLKLGIYQR